MELQEESRSGGEGNAVVELHADEELPSQSWRRQNSLSSSLVIPMIVTVRDLIGLMRLLYRAELAGEASRVKLAKIARIGQLLTEALELAAQYPRPCVGHYAAWTKAREASSMIPDVIDHMTMAQPILKAGERALRRKPLC